MARFAAKTLALVLVLGAAFSMSSVALAEEDVQAIRNVPRISIDELKALMDKNAVLVIDVRDPDSFKKGRIPGAVNVDYTQVLQQADASKAKRGLSSPTAHVRGR